MIKFKKIKWKNILSTGNVFTEIDLCRSQNTLIIGNNGAGKSTILDALCFGLFGKPFRKINKPNLLNSINQSHGVVEVEFTIGKKEYKVIRGIKPTIFEIYCNDELINQDSKAKDYQEHLEKLILKINFKSFTQVVILGSASFVPFMQLSPADRRAIIEDLLDIQIFSTMNNLVKDKFSKLKEDITKNKFELDITEEKIELQKQNIEEHKKYNESEIEKKREEILEGEKSISTLQSEIESIQENVNVLLSTIEDKLSTEKKINKLNQLESKVDDNIKKNKKEISFYEKNDSCPTCKQGIAEQFRNDQISEIEKKVDNQQKGLEQIKEEIGKLDTRMIEIQEINTKIYSENNEVIKKNSMIKALNDFINKLNRQIKELISKKDNLEDDNEKLKSLREQLSVLVKNQSELLIEKQYYEYAATMLKDNGIKTKIIKQYLPIMNKLINKYLTAMDFFVNFNINENFEETIKSRHRDEFSYDNFSEGEKMRIDLALLFTWRQIAKMKNSTNTNLLILDEVFDSSLDSVGTEEFLKLMNEMGTETNVFVISHKGDQLFDKFRSVIKFQKKNNFSEVVK
jgi:DNA repair exonuclease SbcCD ATPase subunit